MRRTILLLLLVGNTAFAQVNLNPGLKAYYPFTGNGDSVSGNNNNPSLTCNNWLNLPSYQSYVSVGDLDITGNQVTLEAVFNRTVPYSNGYNWAGDLVSKHNDPADCNYLLRPNNAEITTTNGFFTTPPICQINLNKTYHVAMVYNGSTLKFYRNGFLMSSVPATGNLFQNNHQTRIGLYDALVHNTQLIGYINEVRIWNVARTQADIQANMNSSLPSPATTPGLLAYYTFDNLLNKQGNPAWNGTLGGSASINATNTSCSFVADSCANPCSNWLNTPSEPSYIRTGDLDISGDKLTVEANFNRTAPVNPAGGYGFLVSKHTGPTNTNYALWPNGCAITTSGSGHHLIFENCDIQLNKTYHVAMVYDGSTLKFYRNGFLHSQTAVNGNLILNNLITSIGQNVPEGAPTIFPFIGYTNEVRIWNVARTQSQIQTYMNSSLPNPTTQTGLVGYYTFDNLLNKQGNATYNATLFGSAAINATNPNCNFLADSCPVYLNIGGTINAYTPVLALNPCDNKITVENASAFNIGDTVLMIQMKGAIIDSTNTAAFGTITDYKNSGNYEFNYVKSKTGNIIELKNVLLRQYDIPAGKVQLVRVPYYQNATITSTLTCLPWDGSKGGVLVLNVQDTVSLASNIDVSGKGFRGGTSPNTGSTQLYCSNNNYFYAAGNLAAAAKGESIATIGNGIAWGKGSPSNGGGGGNGHNSGGGGGGNGSSGGFGGYQLLPCGGPPFDNRGIGGHTLTYNNAQNRIYMGGGGGSGHTDNAGGSNMEGGNGGGIIIIRSKIIKPNSAKIIANGDNARQCNFTTFSDCHDGSGGGGAGGTILIQNNNYLAATAIDAKGGKGGDLIIYNPPASADKIGPGGGGSGGVIWFNAASNPANTTQALNAGANGVIIPNTNDPWGATPGQAGIALYNLNIPVTTVLFKPNIDSVRMKDSATACASFDFKGLAYINGNPISSWQWYFGDGGTATTQNTSHTYLSAGTFTVKLVVTDINGCKDSVLKNVNTTLLTMDAGPADTICNNSSAVLQATSTGATQFSWTPAAYLDNPNIQNPTANPPVSAMFYLTATNAAGCSKVDSVEIRVRSASAFAINPADDVCPTNSIQLLASGGDLYSWTPSSSLNNASVANPTATPTTTTTYSVQITDTLCNNTGNLSTTITVLPLPVVNAIRSNDIDCSNFQSQLSATGAFQYSWSPAATLNNPNVVNPVATPLVTTTYTVTGTDLSGCSNSANVIVKVSAANPGGYFMPTAFTPNNDGKNDCYGIKQWGTITQLEFSIYDRWGTRIFYTTQPGQCWDGTYKGVTKDPDVFVFMIKAKTTCQPEVFRKGTFVLIR